MELRQAPVIEFVNLMQRSLVPPPEAIRLRSWGDQASALTAAWCSEHENLGNWGAPARAPDSIPDAKKILIAARGKLVSLGRPFEAANFLSMAGECGYVVSSDAHVMMHDGGVYEKKK